MKRYNTPHRSRVVKTRLTDEEYADFTARLAPYGMSQSEFIRQAITRATIQDTFLSKFILISNPSRRWNRSLPDLSRRDGSLKNTI